MSMSEWLRPSGRFCDTNACIEARRTATGAVAVRVSGDPDGLVLASAAEWQAFLGAVKAGEYDHMIDSL